MKTIFALLFLCFLPFTVYSQMYLSGYVVEVIDGRTVTIETQTRARLTGKLQFIEVPDDSHSMAETVRKHLEKLVSGKKVQFQTRGMSQFSMMTGVFSVGGVDLSQQMLRDGAAWYELPEKENQSPGERRIYLEMETAAKSEKLGIWNVKDLKPSWEIKDQEQAKEVANEKEAENTKNP